MKHKIQSSIIALTILVALLAAVPASVAEVYNCWATGDCYTCRMFHLGKMICFPRPYGMQGACECQDSSGQCSVSGDYCVAIIIY